jgi:predicted ArsR family transcriptional regulator
MRASLVLGAGRGPRLAVLETIKRFPDGMSVTELTSELGMSYMGVKAHCLALEKTGHLDSFRGQSSKGRPRLLYRLSPRGEELFDDPGHDLALDLLREAAVLFGATAPGKMLAMYFRTQSARYASRISETNPATRAAAFVRMRDAEGRISSFREGPPVEIHECHDPLAVLRKTYPTLSLMEEVMVGEVVGVTVHRLVEGRKIVFRLSGNV